MQCSLPFMLICFLLSGCINPHTEELGPNLAVQIENRTPFELIINAGTELDSLLLITFYDNPFLREQHHQELTYPNFSDTTLFFDLIKPEIIHASFNGQPYYFFAYPGLVSSVTLDINDGIIDSIYTDVHHHINRYCTAIEQSPYLSSGGLWESLKGQYDKVFRTKQLLLGQHQTFLPSWFYRYEQRNIELSYYTQLYSAYTYRKSMLNYDEEFPDAVAQYVDSLVLDRPYFALESFLWLTSTALPLPDYTTDLNFDSLKIVNDALYRSLEPSTHLPENLIPLFILHKYFSNSQSERPSAQAVLPAIYVRLSPTYKQFINGRNTTRSLDNTPMPYFTLEATSGTFTNSNDLKGRPIWISFWFTGCIPCIQEFPAENELVSKYDGTDLQFISICVHSEKLDWLSTIEAHDLKTINLFANSSWTKLLTNRFNIQSYPKWILVNRSGTIIKEKLFAPSDSKVYQQLRNVL